MKIVASICLEAAGKEWFSTTYMVKDDGPVRTARDLRGGTVGVVGIKTATDLWARAGLLNAGIVPDKDAKIFPMAFPGMGDAVRTGKISAGTFVEPFYSAEIARGGLRKLFTAVEAVGYDHELLDIWFGDRFLKANPDAVRAFLADYVAVTKYYLANTAQAKSDLHKSGFVRTPLVEKQIADQAKVHGISEDAVIRDIMLAPAALKRLLEPSEIAAYVRFLCSDDASGITGATQVIDAGWTAR